MPRRCFDIPGWGGSYVTKRVSLFELDELVGSERLDGLICGVIDGWYTKRAIEWSKLCSEVDWVLLL